MSATSQGGKKGPTGEQGMSYFKGRQPCFCKVLLEHDPAIHLHTVRGCFSSRRQRGAAAAEPLRPAKPKTFTTWPFTVKVCQPLSYFKCQ